MTASTVTPVSEEMELEAVAAGYVVDRMIDGRPPVEETADVEEGAGDDKLEEEDKLLGLELVAFAAGLA